MVAPIDSRVALEAGGETFTLALNFRTIALAEREATGVVAGFAGAGESLSEPAVLVWAFAQPAHPTLTKDHALALVVRHPAATMAALRAIFRDATAEEEPAGDDAAGDPPTVQAGA